MYQRDPKRSTYRKGRSDGLSREQPLCGKERRPYDRRVDLLRVLPLWPHEIEDETPEGRKRIIIKLRRTLRAERRRGLAGDWTYDLCRHVELLRVYRLELAAWAAGRRRLPPAQT